MICPRPLSLHLHPGNKMLTGPLLPASYMWKACTYDTFQRFRTSIIILNNKRNSINKPKAEAFKLKFKYNLDTKPHYVNRGRKRWSEFCSMWEVHFWVWRVLEGKGFGLNGTWVQSTAWAWPESTSVKWAEFCSKSWYVYRNRLYTPSANVVTRCWMGKQVLPNVIFILFYFILLFYFYFIFIFRAAPVAYGSSRSNWSCSCQPIHSDCKAGYEPRLWPTLQLMAMPDP